MILVATNSADFCTTDNRFLLADFIGRRNWPTLSFAWHSLNDGNTLSSDGSRFRASLLGVSGLPPRPAIRRSLVQFSRLLREWSPVRLRPWRIYDPTKTQAGPTSERLMDPVWGPKGRVVAGHFAATALRERQQLWYSTQTN